MTGTGFSLPRLRHPRYVLFLAILIASGPMLAIVLPLTESLLLGFDLAVAAFVGSCVGLWRAGNADVLREQARRDDAGRVLLLLLSVLISSIVLVSLTTLVLAQDRLDIAVIALLVASLLACWLFVNLIYAFHYARLYFDQIDHGDRGGLAFPGAITPGFAEFVNFAFVIGMTCQTADIAITSQSIRRMTTFHGLFAFGFNLGILALCVNIVATGTGG